MFNGGQFLTKEHCPRIGGVSKCPIEKYNVHEPATTIEVCNPFNLRGCKPATSGPPPLTIVVPRSILNLSFILVYVTTGSNKNDE